MSLNHLLLLLKDIAQIRENTYLLFINHYSLSSLLFRFDSVRGQNIYLDLKKSHFGYELELLKNIQIMNL